MNKRTFILSGLVAFALLLSSCAVHTNVARILNDPYRYQNRQVHVRGVVTNSVNAVVAGGYRLDDGTGAITVISNGGAPRKGTEVAVTGRVGSGVSVMGQTFGVTIRERDRHTYGGYRRY